MPQDVPTPRGYTKIPYQLSKELTIFVLSCQKCGALVLMTRTHNDWHKKNG